MAKRRLKKKVKIMFFFFILIIILIILIPKLITNKKSNEEIIKEITTTTEKKEDIKNFNLTFVGDLLFEDYFYKAVDNGYDANNYFSKIKDYFNDDDITIANMEVPIGSSTMPVSGSTNYNFCAPPYIGNLINNLNIEVLSTANNHMYDKGIEGVNSTLEYFKNTSKLIVGSYNNEDERTNKILEINGVKFGFLAYTYGTNLHINTSDRNLLGLYKDENKIINEELLKKEIEEVKSKSDILIVMMHWGTEFTFKENEEQRKLATLLNSLGVDIIYGSHSHSIEPIELIGDEHKTLVYYSLGNFASQDDDIARTPLGEETFDNAYNFGLLSKINIEYKDKNINFKKIKTIPVINYFDKDINNFLIVPIDDYNDELESSHLRYNKGFTKDFVKNTFESIIKEDYR